MAQKRRTQAEQGRLTILRRQRPEFSEIEVTMEQCIRKKAARKRKNTVSLLEFVAEFYPTQEVWPEDRTPRSWAKTTRVL